MKRSVVCLLCVLTASADSVEGPDHAAQAASPAAITVQELPAVGLPGLSDVDASAVIEDVQAIKSTVISVGRGMGFNLGLML